MEVTVPRTSSLAVSCPVGWTAGSSETVMPPAAVKSIPNVGERTLLRLTSKSKPTGVFGKMVSGNGPVERVTFVAIEGRSWHTCPAGQLARVPPVSFLNVSTGLAKLMVILL